jgi:hypothetical protein
MAMTVATLADALKLIGNPTDANTMAQGWADAWEAFIAEATELPTNKTASGDPAALALFKTAILPLFSQGQTALQAGTIIKDACKAFWAGTTALILFAEVTPPPAGPFLLPPPFMLDSSAETLFATNLGLVFTANTTGKLSMEDSYDAIAAAILAAPMAGATFLDTTAPTPVSHTVS